MPVRRRSSRQRTAPANQLAGAGTIRRRHDGRGSCRGFTLPEVLLAVAITTIVLGMSVPITASALDEIRTSMAARYLEGRIMNARMLAVKRSTSVALRFESAGGEYGLAEYVDGNGNGVRSAEITSGVDQQLASRQVLRDQFPFVAFGLRAGIPDVDGLRSTAEGDGVRIGTTRILTLGPDGTATSGTLYLHGRRGQYAVRVLGATGRTRVLRFDTGTGRWMSR
jgi:prepilin-type N-terminal cleavage/methylation domain-containing protein